MEVFEHGHCKQENIITCKECRCVYGYYNSDVVTDVTTPDEEALCGGFGVHSYVQCPDCKCIHTIYKDFTPYVSWIDKICEWFKKRKEKRHGRKEKR